MKTLETERLILRAWSSADRDDLFAYARNPNVGPNAGWKPHENPEESAQILRMFLEQDDLWAIEYKENHRVIGSVDLHEDRLRKDINARMLGYVLAEDYWGTGLMTEAARRVIRFAFEEKGLAVLSVFHYPHNLRSRRVIEKCGFVYEGTLRSASRIFDGTVLDGVCYSMLRGEYYASKGNPWTQIGLDDYEEHMKADGVLQMQALNRIMADQLRGVRGRVTLLGAAGGNGLEHIDPAVIEKVYAVDINGKYLVACRERYAGLGGVLQTLQLDLSAGDIILPPCGLMISNLIVEYIGAERFVQVVKANREGIGAVSCVIQKNNGASFVSASGTAEKLGALGALHRDVREDELTEAMATAGYAVSNRNTYPLPNGKEFIRIDFQKNDREIGG